MNAITMRTAPMENELHVPTSTIVGVLLAAAVGFVGWVIRVSARQVLKGFEDALARHGSSIDKNTGAIERIQVHLADLDARLKVVERE